MIHTRVYTKRPNAPISPMYIDVNFDGQRIKAALGLTIETKLWDNNEKEFTAKSVKITNYTRVLNNIKEAILNYYLNQRAVNNSIDIKKIKDIISEHNFIPNEKSPIIKNEFSQTIEEYLEVKSKTQTKASLYIYKITLEEVRDFLKANKKPLRFDSIDHDFFDSYVPYLLKLKNNNSNGLKPIGYANDTIHKRISNLKTFMKWAFERGYHTNLIYQKYTFKKTQKHEIVSLSRIELSQLSELELSNNTRLEKVRDLFLFGIYTGQRWSDITSFKKEDVKGDVWTFHAQKTRKQMQVPLTGFCTPALTILKKYNYVLPQISGQKFNDYIKEVGVLAQINVNVIIYRYSGTDKIKISKPKHEFMSSHMARRTCVTLLLEAGIAPTTIMKLTGHADLKTLLKYENTSFDSLKSAIQNLSI